MYLQTPTIITNSLHLHIKILTATIPPSNHNECPQKYKIAIIKNSIHRAFYIFSSKTKFYKELINIKQILVNNNFTNKLVDQQIKLYLQNIHKNNTTNNNNTNRINLYYRNQMHYNYKLDQHYKNV